jgi:hypothetical protein
MGLTILARLGSTVRNAAWCDMTNKDEIAELRNEVARLKARVEPKPLPTEADAAAHRAAMHEAAERRMARAGNFSREDLLAMEAACPSSVARDIVARGGVRPPSGHGTSGTITSVHGPSGVYPNNSGWRTASPIGPPPGIPLVDQLMDEQDRRDRAELVEREARRRAAEQLK